MNSHQIAMAERMELIRQELNIKEVLWALDGSETEEPTQWLAWDGTELYIQEA